MEQEERTIDSDVTCENESLGCLYIQTHRTGVREAQLIVGLIEAGDAGRPLELLHLAAILNLEQTGKLAPVQNNGWDIFNAVGCADN
jgi:hypothetical protein